MQCPVFFREVDIQNTKNAKGVQFWNFKLAFKATQKAIRGAERYSQTNLHRNLHPCRLKGIRQTSLLNENL